MANEYEIQTLKEQNSDKDIYPNIISGCIPENAVDTSQIKNSAITTEKIEDGAVTAEKISGTFGEDRIADNSISTEKIENGAVTTEKIENGAVTLNKISNITQGSTVATQEYVDEHGGGAALYNHRVRVIMLDSGCSNEGTVYFTVILSTDSPLNVNSFKELFSEEYTDRYDPSDPESEIPFDMQGAYLCPKLHSCYTYYFGVGGEFEKDIELKYFLEEDYFMVGYYGSLTLVSLTDTVTPV